MRTSLAAKSPTDLSVNPFSKKGSLVPFWLLTQFGTSPEKKVTFSINELSRELQMSPFAVFRVVKKFEYDGLIRSEGIRTQKKFWLAQPEELLTHWLETYQIQRKAKLHQLAVPMNIADLDLKSFKGTIPALHTAAREILQTRVSTNKSLELYVQSPETIKALTTKLHAEVQERGYDLLLIEPYYKELLTRTHKAPHQFSTDAFVILTFLELYHFPLRGREQAENLFRKQKVFKKFGSWTNFSHVE